MKNIQNIVDKLNLKEIVLGKNKRYQFVRVEEKMEVPPLLDVQKKPYQDFLDKGIAKILKFYSPIEDRSNKAEIRFLEHYFEGWPEHTKEEVKKRRGDYTVGLKVKARLIKKDTGEQIDQDVYMGEVPLMTKDGSFILKGVERVIVSQIVKSASVYFDKDFDKRGKELFSATLHSPRGTRFALEEKSNNFLNVIIDDRAKVSLGVFLKGFGYTQEEILEIFGHDGLVESTLLKDVIKTEEEALLEIGKKTRPADIPVADKTKEYLENTYFSSRYYDFDLVGRYKYNKKLNLANRLKDFTAAKNIKINNKIVVKKGEKIPYDKALEIQNSGINSVLVQIGSEDKHMIIGNARVDITKYVDCNPKDFGISELVYYPTLKKIIDDNKTKKDILEAIKENVDNLQQTYLTLEDVIGSVSYLLGLKKGLGNTDNIDHLANRRIATVGELLANEFRKGMGKLADNTRENLQSKDLSDLTPKNLISSRHIQTQLRNFLAVGQLAQMTEDHNPASAVANKRRITAIGPGGIKANRAQADVRDIHYSHYGRICVIETSDGNKVGLQNGFATYAKINKHGFIETPYRKVDKKKGVVTDEIVYMMADEEENYNTCQAQEPLNENKEFVNEFVICRHIDTIIRVPSTKVDYMDVSPRQFISTQSSLVPFMENNDTVRALTASNMQRQAVPLLESEAPLVATGMEHRIARDSGATVIAEEDGVVNYVDAKKIIVKSKSGKKKEYLLNKMEKTNHDTAYNQKPIVSKGEKVALGDVIADGYATSNGELAIGKNLKVAFMVWEGYNYEDAVLISDRLVKDDTLTSVSIKTKNSSARTTKLGDEEITRDIPNVSQEAIRHLDENGIVRIGAEVKVGDYLVGKVTPKGEKEPTPEEKLLRAIFGDKARDVKDNSLKVEHGSDGVVVDVKIVEKSDLAPGDKALDPGENKRVEVYVAKKRKINVGDKLAGRHGNKGVISRILPAADMPYDESGEPVDIVLNPLGVPSRMNIGQVLETHMGLIAKQLGLKFLSPAFNGANESDIQQLFNEVGLPLDGKINLYDGRTGEKFDNKVTVGSMYIIKLHHMSESKINARSTGSYSLVTGQPLGGKAVNGGQRLGEMEVWGLEAYGASSLLQEMLTVKSDDFYGRNAAYNAIVRGEQMKEPGIPETFKVLVKEFQSMGIDVSVITDDEKELSIKDISSENEPDRSPKKKEKVESVDIGIDDGIDFEDNKQVKEDSTQDDDDLFDFDDDDLF